MRFLLRSQRLFSADHIKPQPHGDWAQFAELGRQHGFDYLAVVVVSSTEQEYPVTLFLGLTTHAQPGFRRDNWSLLEFALLDLKHNQILMQAEGRGWATLDRPSAPGIDQWYPAIYLRPQDERRIWPPTYAGAPNTLRVVSFEQAAQRLVLKLQNSWRRGMGVRGGTTSTLPRAPSGISGHCILHPRRIMAICHQSPSGSVR